jgi:hypothetical protein
LNESTMIKHMEQQDWLVFDLSRCEACEKVLHEPVIIATYDEFEFHDS